MVAAANHNQIWSAERRDGATSLNAASRARHIKFDQSQLPARSPSYRANWRGFTALPFFFIALTGAGVQTGRAVSLLDTIADQLPCKIAGPLKVHSICRLSSVTVSNDRDRDTKGLPSAGTPFWKAGNVFR